MLNIRIGALHITREGKGIRFTIPISHSSTILTQDETRQLLNELVREFRTKTRTIHTVNGLSSYVIKRSAASSTGNFDFRECARCGYVMKVDLQTCAQCGADNGES
jgi:hypothetical protein